MAQLGGAFNAQEHDTTQKEGGTVPNGIYDLEVVASEIKSTQTGGTMMKLQVSIIEPAEYESRRIFPNINLENANPQAQEIGQRELASLCRACGLSTITDSDELHLIRFRAKVGLERKKVDDGYPPKNKIVRYYYPDEGDLPPLSIDAPANDNRPATPAARPAPAATPAAAAAKPAGTRPWGGAK